MPKPHREIIEPRAGVFFGWKVVAVAFVAALFSWGLSFYGLGIYLVVLHAEHGLGDAFDRFGPRTVVAPWFEHKRGLAVSLALNGASAGGLVLVPLWTALIATVGWRRRPCRPTRAPRARRRRRAARDATAPAARGR